MPNFEWDEVKSTRNLLDPERRRGFEDAAKLWDADGVEAQLNVNSGEQVYLRAGYLNGQVWGAMFVVRASISGDRVIRILSFRRLNDRERKKYGLY